jgi:hypothetical protein
MGGASCIVKQRFHVFDRGSEREGTDAAGFAIEGNHVLPPCRSIMKHEHFPAALGAEIEQLISSAPQKAG